MKIVSFTYEGQEFIYNIDRPNFYHYDKLQKVHCIYYMAYTVYGNPYKVEWRIPDTLEDKSESGKEYAKRMTRFLSPWDVINIYRKASDEEAIC